MKEDYPRNLVELEARFSTEEACREYLLKLRWPEGFVCPRCGIQSSWASKRNLLLCADCGYQASVTAGTIFQDTRKPLTFRFNRRTSRSRGKLCYRLLQQAVAADPAPYNLKWGI